MSVLFLNCTGETFTPTRSGALSTWIWEMCLEAEKDGVKPLVITRRTNAEPHPWPNTVFLDYPWIPTVRGTGIGRLLRIQQKLSGWGHLRQKSYGDRVVRAIRKAGAETMPMVLQNDPEMAVYLRRHFPKAFIVHLFQNVNECGEPFRSEFAHSVDVALAVSDYCARSNAEYFGMAKYGVGVLYNGVNTSVFHPLETTTAGPPIINFIGRTDYEKAPDLLMKAAKIVAQSTRAFSLQILGARYYWGTEPDDYQREIEALAQELEQMGIPVRRPGVIGRHDLPGELRRAHIHVVPSRWEDPCPLTTLEGMACGLPVVGARSGGIPELIGSEGLLFERDEVDALAFHLGHLVKDAELRLTLGMKARRRAEQFSWARTWSELRETINRGIKYPDGVHVDRNAFEQGQAPMAFSE